MNTTHHKRGTPVRSTANIAKPVSTTETGLFATLAGLVHVKGSGASKTGRGSGAGRRGLNHGRRLVLSALVATLGVLAFASAPALAAETPETGEATGITATTATLEGALNPNAPGQPGSYQFSYAPSATECTGEGAVLDPASPEFAMGAEKEAKSVTVTGLEPNREYAFCLIAYSLSFEPSEPSVAVPFKTRPAKPSILDEKASVSSTAATLEAQVDPNNESTSYVFEYSAKGKAGAGEKLEGTIVKLKDAEALSGYGYQTATVPKIEKLSAGTSYFYRVLATNATGTTTGPVQEFATVATPHTEAVTASTATTATFHGTLTPLNAKVPTKYSFDYRIGKECTGGDGSETPPTGTSSTTVSEAVTGLQPNATYSVCLVSINAFGSEVDPTSPQVRFTTSAAPPAVESETSNVLGSEEVSLEAVVNPDNQETTCKFEYGTEPALKAGTTATVACREALGNGGGGVNTSVTLSGLTPATTYYYRVAATNASGTTTDPPIESFETQAASAPVVKGESASTVEAAAATLEAEIAPENAATSYYFEYGTGEAYETHTPEAKLPTTGKAEARIKGLTPGRTYHYKVIATNKLAPSGVPGSGQEFTTREGPIATAETCPNAQRRAEQPFGLGLPDCRAYELVSPVDTGGQNATEEEYDQRARAAEEGAPAQPTAEPAPAQEGGAVTYAASGPFSGTPAGASGATVENQYVSRRDPEHNTWTTQPITPLHNPRQAEDIGSYTHDAFNPQLTEGIAYTNAPLTEGAPHEFALYAANFADGSYRYITDEFATLPLGVSSDLSRVVFGEFGVVSEWAGGTPFPVGVTNNENNNKAELVHAAVAGWRAVSATGSDVAFVRNGQLYVRVNAGQPQSQLEQPEAEGSGTLTKGSKTVSALTAASGVTALTTNAGSTELELTPTDGRFVVGEMVSGPGIKAETTITAIEEDAVASQATLPEPEEILTLSKPTEDVPGEAVVSSGGPSPFVVGDRIAGAGVPENTTVTGVAEGSLTLSAEATASETGEQLVEGGGCTASTEACTVEASASHRLAENPAGAQPAPAQYRGASVDGSKVFFTSTAELTEDAYAGPAGEGSNLYRYEPATNTLTDLTSADKTGAGADVQGVAQISEDGSYVYFVADGDLAGEAQEGQPNLYVSHDGGEPSFIATLGGEDSQVWGAGLESNLASVSPNGQWLAFLSKAELESKAAGLARYDNAPVRESECEGEVGFTNQNESGHCQEAYLYDASSGRLVCASCNPTGARPLGPANFGEQREGPSLYRPRVVTDEGRLFFGSFDKLVPGANGLQNVYEYEDGHVSALSDASGGYGSFLLDTSVSGGDVFFATSDKLLPEDESNNVVVYDARVDGGFPISPAAPSCNSGDSCKPPESAQPSVFGPTGSATFNGLGNFSAPSTAAVTTKKKTTAELRAEKLAKALKQCRKEKSKQKRASCEKSARKRYAPVKTKKKKATKSANTDRRTQS
jgi:hypothetical protein